MARTEDFSLVALREALDAQRRERGLSWAGVMREMSRPDLRPGRRRMSASTVAGIGTRTVAEGDGVLQMLRWLGRTPESFIPGCREDDGRIPDAPAGKVIRFDTRKLYAAIDAKRAERGLTWEQVSEETGWGVNSMANLTKGGRTVFPGVMRLTRWLKQPAVNFTKISDK
jgi:hypothetical protein